MAETYSEYIVSKEEYNAEIARLTAKVNKAKSDYDYNYNRMMVHNQASHCAGMRGFTGGMKSCDWWKLQNKIQWENDEKPKWKGAVDSAQKNLDKYIHSVREAEKQKQIDDIRLAIREAVAEEEARIAKEAEDRRLAEIKRLQDEENARIEKERLQEEARLAEIESKKINFQLTKGTEAVGMTTLGLSPFIIGGAVLYLMSRKEKKK